MAKIVKFDIVNNCNRRVTVKIKNASMSINQGETKEFRKEEGADVLVYPHNASYTKKVGTVDGSTIVISGYDK